MADSENRCKIASIPRDNFSERDILVRSSVKPVAKCLKSITGRVLFYVVLPAISITKYTAY